MSLRFDNGKGTHFPNGKPNLPGNHRPQNVKPFNIFCCVIYDTSLSNLRIILSIFDLLMLCVAASSAIT